MAPHHLERRVSLAVSNGALIAILVSLLLVILFCLGVLFLMWRRKRTLAARRRDLAQEQQQLFVARGHEQHVPQPIDQRAYMDTEPNGPIELHGGVMHHAQNKSHQQNTPQLLDGYAAPATMGQSGRPVEMAAGDVKK